MMSQTSDDGARHALRRGRTIFDYADELAVRVPTSCGRAGVCHECIVEIKRGADALGPRTASECFLGETHRLACQAVIADPGVELEFAPLQRRPRILSLSPEPASELDPLVTRAGDAVYYDGQRVDDYRGHMYGIAVDLGTTTIVVEAIDLETGIPACVTALENPQRFAGSDVMNRISYDTGPYHGELHRSVISALNQQLKEICTTLGITRHEIYEVVIVGNSTMRDLFFDIDVESIGQRPYKSRLEHDYRAGLRQSTSITELAHNLGVLTHPQARIFGGPLIASHVGADTAADLLAIDIESQDEVMMLVDIGTNTEVVVGHRGRLVAASCPAGPAFEGGLVSFGMTACDGAIETIQANCNGWVYRTIGDAPPAGICGSGLIDLLAELRRHGRMTPKGVFAGKARQLDIVPERGITFSREDASALAQAKAANSCGQAIAMRTFGVDAAGISRLYLAGAFANYVNVRNAVEIGFLAPVPMERVVKIGNAALAGARRMLVSRRKRNEIEALVKRVEHVELETTPDFFDLFVEGCQFKPITAQEPKAIS